MPNFVQIGQTVAEIWPFFDFQDGGHPPSWIFKKLERLTANTPRRAKMRHHAKFCAIGQGVAEIWPFLIFQDGGCPPSCIFKS